MPAILPSLTSIINATFEFDTFPLAWKTAEVTPILKAGDHDIPNNNRPISLLPVLSKVCERVAHNQLTRNTRTAYAPINVNPVGGGECGQGVGI